MRKGLTIIELLIGMTLFGIVMATANIFLFTSLRGARKASATGITKAEGAYAMNAMVTMIRYARNISCGCVAPCTSNTLTINRINGDSLMYRLDTTPLVSDTIASESGTRRVELTSARVAISSTACSGGNMFSCSASNRSVAICYNASAVGSVDVSDSESVSFSSEVSVRNFGN